MNFDLTDEQTMLREALIRFLGDRYGFEARRALRKDRLGWSRPVWAWLAEQGYLGVSFAEDDGGLGGGAVEMMIIGEACGAHLLAEPYLATVVFAGTALRLSADTALRSALIPRIAAGEFTAAFAHEEPLPATFRHPMTGVRAGDGWRLSGEKIAVVHGDSADRLLVTAATLDGLGVFLVDSSAPGVLRRGYATFDGLRAADLRLNDTPTLATVALGVDAEMLVERVRQHAIAFLAAEAVGIMRVLLELTCEHLRTREQFGQPLARFQALQHRAVEMLIAIEQAESIKIYAAMMTEESDPVERRKAFAAAKIVIGGAARLVGQGAVQLHGGIGVTDEYRVGWGMKRLTMIEMMLGNTDHHLAALADLGGFLAAAE
jgi:alkylation response protein AidB-like acyl-CoA dehydrogenase